MRLWVVVIKTHKRGWWMKRRVWPIKWIVTKWVCIGHWKWLNFFWSFWLFIFFNLIKVLTIKIKHRVPGNGAKNLMGDFHSTILISQLHDCSMYHMRVDPQGLVVLVISTLLSELDKKGWKWMFVLNYLSI